MFDFYILKKLNPHLDTPAKLLSTKDREKTSKAVRRNLSSKYQQLDKEIKLTPNSGNWNTVKLYFESAEESSK